jgi:hypothetical protein
MLRDASTFPFRQSGWIMILLGAIFSLVMSFFSRAPSIGAGSIFGLSVSGYFIAFFYSILNTTMTDHDDLPDWPEFTNFWDDILSPFARFWCVVAITILPVIILFFGLGYLGWVPSAILDWLSYLGFAYFACYLPMAILAVQAQGSLWAAWPKTVYPAIFRVLPGYIWPVVTLLVGFGLAAFFEDVSKSIPFAGVLLAGAISLYSLMFQARYIGLIYRDKREALGW